MHQVYLLLRNNQQTGPHSLEDLVRLKLKPFDLVWVEGRSAAWQYPDEVAALKPYVPETPVADLPYMPIATAVLDRQEAMPVAAIPPTPAQTKKIFVSLPQTIAPMAAAQPAIPPTPKPEEIFIPAIPARPAAAPSPTEPEVKYAKTLHQVEEDYTHWVFRQKTKKKSRIAGKYMATTALVLAVIGGGYYLLSNPSLTDAHLPASGTAAVQPVAAQTVATPAPALARPVPPVAMPAPADTKPEQKHKQVKALAAAAPRQKSGTALPAPVAQKPAPQESRTADPAIQAADPAPDAGTVTPAKKKKLRDVIKDIFSKSKRKQEAAAQPEVPVKGSAPAAGDPKPATNRQAARRSDETRTDAAVAAPQEVHTTPLAEQVEISSNAPDSWMMGVTGLKVTLHNRSAATLRNAAVDVLYYDQNNRLLEKKTIYFNNVQPKGKQTLAAPDHKWADHVAFKVVNITAKEDGYVHS